MFGSLFKKPSVDAKDLETLRESEDALQQRTNRLLRQGLKVVHTPPPLHTPLNASRAIAEALRRSA